ncbi:rhomboid family intramembrane serine protease [Halarchaeum nitratireducens]|uniref:Rhomboid family intramembrane serine protease n=2 Tax=Halarchaeum nitratireducens TaxID=489913 RepID=A0A830GAK1_9EURY|nr:rhomboid family intramembrane serine protease [Halarchaeum nitratireducens]
MPYRCRFCGGTYCEEHRLPENHDCPGLDEWDDPAGVFGPEETGREEKSRVERAVQSVGATGGPLGYLRGNVAYVFLGLMVLTVGLQGVVSTLGISSVSAQNLFTLNTTNLLWVYPWFTSIFAHGGFAHLLVNGIALYFFGPTVERRVGSGRFAALFLGAGALAGLAQVGTAAFLGQYAAVLGASGAIMAVMGVLTVLNPSLRVYIYFILPVPLWLFTLGFAAYSLFVTSVGGIGSGGVAQVAHLAGLAVGLVYGAYLKSQGGRAPDELTLGGGPGGPGGPGRGRI